MLDLTGLAAALGEEIELEFRDGAVVHARLLLLVLHEPQRLIYQVRPITAPAGSASSGLIVTAELAELKAWRAI
jgi:hypothetical protein